MSSMLLASHVVPRQEDEGRIWTQPEDSDKGRFIFPVTYPIEFREGSAINMSWSTTYTNVNLYFYQRGKVANSVQLATNLANQWYQWEVRVVETNLTNPFVFRVVNAQGTNEEQTQDGFWSTSWYIKRDDVASESVTSSSSLSSSLAAPSSASSPSASSSIRPSSTAQGTETEAAAAPSTTAEANDGGISKNTIIGLTVGLVIAGILIIVGVVLYLKKHRRNKTTPSSAAVPTVSHHDYDAAQKQPENQPMHEAYVQPSELHSAPPLYELPSQR